MPLLILTFMLLSLFSSSSNGTSQEDTKEFKEAMAKAANDHGIDPDNLKPGETYMTPPVMTEEEEGSRQMPRAYRCSGCFAAAYQFQKGFATAEKKRKKGSKLPYSDVLDITEQVCEKKFRGYGLKSVNGEKFLSGEGLKHDKEMGVMEAGGKWEVRLQDLCGEIIELYEEEGIYDLYVQRGDKRLDVSLCSSYCTQAEIEDMKNWKDEL